LLRETRKREVRSEEREEEARETREERGESWLWSIHACEHNNTISFSLSCT
jgi:hypothetical protein